MRLDIALVLLRVSEAVLLPVARAATVAEARRVWSDDVLPEIRKAYKARVFDTHPDRGGSAEEFRQVQEAWEGFEKTTDLPEILWQQTHRPVFQRARVFVFHPFPGGDFVSPMSDTSTTTQPVSGFGSIWDMGVPFFVKRSR